MRKCTINKFLISIITIVFFISFTSCGSGETGSNKNDVAKNGSSGATEESTGTTTESGTDESQTNSSGEVVGTTTESGTDESQDESVEELPDTPTGAGEEQSQIRKGSGKLRGSGFGSYNAFKPTCFLDFNDLKTGMSWADLVPGGTEYAETNGTIQGVDMSDGIASGGGRLLHAFNKPDTDEWFTHYSVPLSGSTAVTVFKYAKVVHVSGETTSSCQYKGTRITTNSYGNGVRISDSLWYPSSLTIGSYNAPHIFREGDTEKTPAGESKFTFFDGKWHCNIMQAKMNSADDVSDGIARDWWDGTYHMNFNNADLIDTEGLQFTSVQPNPGCANGFRQSGDWEISLARLVVIEGLGWIAFGNAATFPNCTELLPVEATSWSDTEITFKTHGIVPDEFAWVYVMNKDGNLVSDTGLTGFTIGQK